MKNPTCPNCGSPTVATSTTERRCTNQACGDIQDHTMPLPDEAFMEVIPGELNETSDTDDTLILAIHFQQDPYDLDALSDLIERIQSGFADYTITRVDVLSPEDYHADVS